MKKYFFIAIVLMMVGTLTNCSNNYFDELVEAQVPTLYIANTGEYNAVAKLDGKTVFSKKPGGHETISLKGYFNRKVRVTVTLYNSLGLEHANFYWDYPFEVSHDYQMIIGNNAKGSKIEDITRTY